MNARPSLRLERSLLRVLESDVSRAPDLLNDSHAVLAGIDEVGRGALAGPVSVGVFLVDLTTISAPTGVRDSKLLTPMARERLVPRLRRWGLGHAVGHASAQEIDQWGIMAALRTAAQRALDLLPRLPDLVVLDGSHDWLSVGQPGEPVVHTVVKADQHCAAVAAASVVAKVERDALMSELGRRFPAYGWAANKGYSAPGHIAALRECGPCVQHRRSWRLPGVNDDRVQEQQTFDLECVSSAVVP